MVLMILEFCLWQAAHCLPGQKVIIHLVVSLASHFVRVISIKSNTINIWVTVAQLYFVLLLQGTLLST